MGVGIKQAVIEALEHRLFPVMARWFLQAGVSVQEAIDLLRAAAIQEALKSVPKGISPDSISLASIRTGMSRRLVRESLSKERHVVSQPGEGGHRGERVLAGWWHDPDFRDDRGRPRILPVNAGTHSFKALCRRYSGETQHRTILKDLEQAGAVAVLERGDRVQVLRRSYAAAGWTEAGQAAMAEQLAEHIETCLHNFEYPEGSRHLLCRRVANALVQGKHAKILLRDIRDRIDSQADLCYDDLTDPQYTADPLDPDAEHISVTFYINRKPVRAGASEVQSPEAHPKKDADVVRKTSASPSNRSKRRSG